MLVILLCPLQSYTWPFSSLLYLERLTSLAISSGLIAIWLPGGFHKLEKTEGWEQRPEYLLCSLPDCGFFPR